MDRIALISGMAVAVVASLDPKWKIRETLTHLQAQTMATGLAFLSAYMVNRLLLRHEVPPRIWLDKLH